MYFANERNKKLLIFTIFLIISSFSLGASLFASYKIGQIGSFFTYGYNRECRQIVGLISQKEKIWINDIGWDRLPYVLRSENVQEAEWRWQLSKWVPKKNIIITEKDFYTYDFNWKKESTIKNKVKENQITKIIYINLNELKTYEQFFMQGRADELLSFSWLKLTDTVEMKNKTVYVFDVVESELD